MQKYFPYKLGLKRVRQENSNMIFPELCASQYAHHFALHMHASLGFCTALYCSPQPSTEPKILQSCMCLIPVSVSGGDMALGRPLITAICAGSTPYRGRALRNAYLFRVAGLPATRELLASRNPTSRDPTRDCMGLGSGDVGAGWVLISSRLLAHLRTHTAHSSNSFLTGVRPSERLK